MNGIKKNWLYFLVGIIILIIFKTWFTPGTISGGDFIYAFPSMFENRSFFPYAWDWNGNYGLGSFAPPLQWVNTVYAIPILLFGALLHLSWNTIERVGFFYPYLLLSLFSSWYLAKKVFRSPSISVFAALFYSVNTYALMMSGGGQIVGVGLSYAVVPLALARFIILHEQLKEEKNNLHNIILFVLTFALVMLFDIRYAYVLMLALGIYLLMHYRASFAGKGKYLVYLCVVPLAIIILLHAFWLLPLLVIHQVPTQALDAAYNSTAAVSFFSFARFENTISLLHPNWPENIFGKVSFMRPEFLLIPILAFLSLLFITKKKRTEARFIIYFAFLGLVGAFLAKGSNEPFGSIYLWLFAHFPGFSMFRDPSKWYNLVAISYSLLVPFVVWKIYNVLQERKNFNTKIVNIQQIFVILIIGYFLFLIRPAWLGQLSGTLTTHAVPSDYKLFAQKLEQDNTFYRTLWFPTIQRYSYTSSLHPAVSAQDLFNRYDQKQLLTLFRASGTETQLQNAGIRYVIIPDDSDQEIFLKDRKYSEILYQNAYTFFKRIPWLHEEKDFGRLKVFTVENAKDHLWSLNKNMTISYTQLSPVQFRVKVQNAKQNDLLIFAESYDPHWLAIGNDTTLSSTKYQNRFNAFVLPKDGTYSLVVTYQPQQWTNIGVIITLVSLFVSIGFIFAKKKK